MEPLWNPYGGLWSIMEPYGALGALMEPYKGLWVLMEPYRAPHGALWSSYGTLKIASHRILKIGLNSLIRAF